MVISHCEVLLTGLCFLLCCMLLRKKAWLPLSESTSKYPVFENCNLFSIDLPAKRRTFYISIGSFSWFRNLALGSYFEKWYLRRASARLLEPFNNERNRQKTRIPPWFAFLRKKSSLSAISGIENARGGDRKTHSYSYILFGVEADINYHK